MQGKSSIKSDNHVTSSIFHDNTPQFFENFRLDIQPEDFLETHVRFEVYSLSKKTKPELIGFTYMKLNAFNTDAIISSGRKSLSIIKIDKSHPK